MMTRLVRLLCGLVFVTFGIGKFLSHASEVRSFRGYGIPLPEVVVPALGAVELAGGVLLLLLGITGPVLRLTATVLALVMVGAISTSGVQHGETVSLTLAPAMLVGMLLLLRSEGAFRRGRGPRRPSRSPHGRGASRGS